MKTILIGIIAMLLLSMAFVAAEENETLISPTPDNQTVDQETIDEINDNLNESVSAVDTTLARIGIWLTFNQEKKAEKELKLARLELIRASIAAKNNDSEAMEKALEAHNRIIEKIQERIDSLDGKATKAGIKETAEKLVGLERAIEVHEARISKLKEILANNNLTEEQIANIQAKIEHAENVTAHLKDVEAAKVEKLKTKLKAVANMTDEEAENEIEELQNAKNLSAVKKLVKETKAARNENAAQTIARVIAKLEARQNETGKNMSSAISALTNVQQKLESRAKDIRENNRTKENSEESEENETEVKENETEED